MLLIHCPNCDHDNTPGERFCAKCGVPLNLKPCPHCGKVDQLAATVCSGCGAAFPPIVLAHPDPDTVPPPQTDQQAATASELVRPQHTQGAWPLILMAVVAGGIPLLWMNRAYIPLPKAWQVKSPAAAGSAVRPVTQPSLAPPKVIPPAAGAQPTDPRPPVAAKQPPVAKPVVSKEMSAATPAKQVRAKRKPTVKTASRRPCTEALTALGLCQPKTARR
jgi:Double zinc ribbon